MPGQLTLHVIQTQQKPPLRLQDNQTCLPGIMIPGSGQPGWEFSCNCTHRASLSLKFWKFHAALQVCLVGCIALPCVIESIMYSLSFENIVFHSCGLQLCKLIGTKECVYVKNESNSHRIVSRDQHSGRDFMSKGSISC